MAVSPEGLVLLVEQYRHGLGRVCLELPAGRMNPADADPVAAARRELLEEMGCSGEHAQALQATAANPASYSNLVHTVLVRGVRRTASPLDDPTERI